VKKKEREEREREFRDRERGSFIGFSSCYLSSFQFAWHATKMVGGSGGASRRGGVKVVGKERKKRPLSHFFFSSRGG
jgi:hypothetical protein